MSVHFWPHGQLTLRHAGPNTQQNGDEHEFPTLKKEQNRRTYQDNSDQENEKSAVGSDKTTRKAPNQEDASAEGTKGNEEGEEGQEEPKIVNSNPSRKPNELKR